MIFVFTFISVLGAVSSFELSERNQACDLLLAYDDTVDNSFGSNAEEVLNATKQFVKRLNIIYENTNCS